MSDTSISDLSRYVSDCTVRRAQHDKTASSQQGLPPAIKPN